MANKKSAKSKGYRKTIAKKPYVTKKELIITGVIAVIVLLAFVLINVIYDDGALKVVDGSVVTEGENSLVAASGYGDSAKFYKLGQLADVEGYSLAVAGTIDNVNVFEYAYTPEAESAIDEISVTPYLYDSTLLGEATRSSIASDTQNVVCSDMIEIDLDGREVEYYIYTQARDLADPEEDPETAAAEEAAGLTPYIQSLNAYINAGENRCICIHIKNAADSEAEYVEDSVLVDAMNLILPAVSYETK